MLDSLLDGIKDQVTSTIADKVGLDMGTAEKAIPVAKDSIMEGITGAVAGGNAGGIVDMLKGAVGGGGVADLAQNMVYKSIAGSFISKATSALGIGEDKASMVSSLALPMLMSKLGGAAQAAGDTDDIDESSIMSAMGLDAGGLLGKAADLLGGGAGKAGGVADQAKDLLGGLGNMFGK